MRNNMQNHHTQASAPRQSSREHTFASFHANSEEQKSSFGKKYKEFLLQNSSPSRKNCRAQTIDQSSRMNTNNSMKKSTIYRKLLNSSSSAQDNYTITEQMARYREKFESAARKGVKDLSSSIFRQFWEQEQKKKFNQSRENNSETIDLRVDTRKNQKKADNVKTFEKFIEFQKKQGHNRGCSENYNLISITVADEKKNENLAVSGNPKELRNKERNQILKRLGIRKNKTQMLAQQIKDEKLNSETEDLFGTNRTNGDSENLNNSNHKFTPKYNHAGTPNKNNYGTYCFKNFYSPYNGIQIKYLSIENQGLEVYPSSKKIVPKNTYNSNTKPLFKKKQPEIKDKSIIFKPRGTRRVVEANPVQGWKVQQDFNQDFDLCHPL